MRNCDAGTEAAAAPAGRARATSPEKSHAIRLGEVSTKLENVAMPTIQFQDLKGSWGNCMRNWVWAQQ